MATRAAAEDRTVELIYEAQLHGHFRRTLPAAPSKNRCQPSCPPWSVAFAEIVAGEKKSHWIWYVWPSLRVVRSSVGEHARKFLLPNMKAVQDFLGHQHLRHNIVAITIAASKHLEAGVSPLLLFGKMHRYDCPKFVETCTVMAVAAMMMEEKNEGTDVVAVFRSALTSFKKTCLQIFQKAFLRTIKILCKISPETSVATLQLSSELDLVQGSESKSIEPSSSAADGNSRKCAACTRLKQTFAFSKSQLRKRPGESRCRDCLAAQVPGVPSGDFRENNLPPKPLDMSTRPLGDVPGFDGRLRCCLDWPKTRNGNPPRAQSAIFNPLLACVVGPIDGFYTIEQLQVAHEWWCRALPAWNDWVQRLKSAGVPAMRDKLIKSAKGRPNPLIHKAKGRGKVPHFRGRVQNEALEMAMDVAIEVYACTACLYTGIPRQQRYPSENSG